MPIIGTPLRRLEDERLVKGRGSFTDDIHPDGLVEAHFVRSPHAHARIRNIDLAAARSHPGVLAAFAFDDLVGVERVMPMIIPDRRILHPKTQEVLAHSVVHYVGQPVALIVASSRYVAEDAAELVSVEYETLSAVSALRDAARPGAPLVHPEAPSNVAGSDRVAFGNVDEELRTAPHVIRQRFEISRGHAQSLETRAVVARYDDALDHLTLWDTTQAPIPLRGMLARMLGLDEGRVRVIAPDIGGGFGPKMAFYPEELLVPYAALRLRRPVKWVEDRLESFVATASEREQIHDVTVAFDNEGRLRAFKDDFLYETGAFIPYGLNTPFVTTMHLFGLYKIPSFAVKFDAIFTNRMFCCPYRGAGRPYAAFVIERMIDRIAKELRLDPAEVRRRNLIQPSDMPFRYPATYWDGGPVEFDTGDYPRMLQEALARISYEEIRADQPRLWQSGRYVGVATAAYSEITGIGPYEGARVHVRPDGRVIVASGVGSQGQGHRTTLTQIVAEELGVAPPQVEVTTGDTATFEWGIGTFASRGAVTAGNAVRLACRRVADQAKRWAGERLEVSLEDLELADGMVRVKGVSGHGVSLAEIAAGANPARGRIVQDPASFRPGLEAEAFFNPAQGTMGAGVHACVIEVDLDVANAKILRYVVVHDCGRLINPQIVEGQIMGGVALGVGGAFYERLAYDETGQLLTGTYMDYLIPTAAEIPAIEVLHLESASPHNPLGVKGVGEAGTIPVAAVVAAAIEDALTPLDARLVAMPIDGPSAVWQAIRGASQRPQQIARQE
jgi:aerobic carbon-monoxide dehydrogenase large subunit